jgi:hypothetical protein
MKRIKTDLRSAMGEKRLNGLALLSVHRDLKVDIDAIIDNFAMLPRRLDFRY